MTLAETAAAERPVADAAGAPPPTRGWLRSLFPEPASAGPSRRAWLLGTVGFLALMAVSISRTGGPGALDSIWIEDARRFLWDALNEPTRDTIFKPFNGYFHIGPRLAAELVSHAPIRWTAPLLTLIAVALIATAAAVAYTASGRFFDRWWQRLLVAVPVVAVPVGHTQADNDIATVQFFAFYALFWVLLWRPRGVTGAVVAVGVTLYATTCSILPVVLLPLVVLRLVAVRDWTSRIVGIAYAAGMGLQLYGAVSGTTSRAGVGEPRYNPLWLLGEYVGTAVPRALFGEKWLGGPGTGISGWPEPLSINTTTHVVLAVAAWLLVAGAVLVGLRKVTRPHWPLAITAVVASGLFFAAAVSNMGWTQPRYVIPTALLIYVALVAILRPAAGPPAGSAAIATRVPVFALVALLAVVCAVNLRGPNGRSTSQAWTETVRQATVHCTAIKPAKKWFDYRHTWWTIRIPCKRLR